MARRDAKRNKFKDLSKRTEESHHNREDSGTTKSFFDAEKMQGVPTWWAGKDDHIIDIIPYFAGTVDPRNKEGEPTYHLDILVHRFVGPMNEMFVCLGQFNNGKCPICEEAIKQSNEDADWKTVIKPLRPSRRTVYNIVVRDGGDQEKKGVQVFEIAHWFMERHLSKIAKDPRGDGFITFSDPDEGKSISFARTGVGSENTQYEGHRFIERDPISNEELDAAFTLDDLIEIRTYDEIYASFHGVDSAPDESTDEPEDPDTGGTEEETPEPAKQRRRGARKDTDNELPECPGGGTIGVNIDEYKECDNCDFYTQCEDIAEG